MQHVFFISAGREFHGRGLSTENILSLCTVQFHRETVMSVEMQFVNASVTTVIIFTAFIRGYTTSKMVFDKIYG